MTESRRKFVAAAFADRAKQTILKQLTLVCLLFLLVPCTAQAAIQFRAATKDVSETVPLTASKPAGTTVGDLLIAFVMHDTASACPCTPPAGQGWTAFSLPGTESGFTSRAWYKQVDAADAPRTDYTFTFTAGNNSAILYLATFYEDSGIGNWTLEDGTGWAFNAAANSLSNGGVTADDNSLFVVAYGNDDNEVVTTDPIGPTKIDEDAAAGAALAAYYEMVDAIDGSVSYPITWGGGAEQLSAMAGIFSWGMCPGGVVTTTADSGAGSLRTCINVANATPGLDTIAFNIAGAGPHTIQPTSALPAISDSVIINGTTEPDFAGTPIVVLDGALAGAAANGLVISGSGGSSTIRGLVIQNFVQTGILLQGPNNLIAGNYIGIGADGSTLGGNNIVGNGLQGGIRIESASNTIGGTIAADRNVISGNIFSGVALVGIGANGNQILGNYVGLDAGGTLDRGNTQEGIEIELANNTVIGGTIAGARNILSGNGSDGIEIDGANSTIVQGNYIGTDFTGNVIIANDRDGIDLNVSGAVGSTGTLIGGTAANAGNLIRGNNLYGISLRDAPTINNSILGNRIYQNALIGIDLNNDGITVNDAFDADSGPNNLLNYPVITAATANAGTVFVDFDLDVPAGDYRIEFFTNPSGADPSGNGEGEVFESSVNINHTGSGVENFSHSFAGAAGDILTATTTQCTGGACASFQSTSEFSGAITAVAGPPPLCPGSVVTTTTDATAGGSLRACIIAANTNPGADTITVPVGTYNLTIAGTGEDAAATGDLDITDALTLNGAGAGSTIIDGTGIDRVFHVLVGPTVTISDVTIRDGDAAADDGGGIWNESNLTLNDVTMTNNAARDGGAIFSEQNPNSLTLSNVALNGNSATRNGGAIGMIDDNASLTFTDVTITGNTAAAIGGAFYGERASGTMTRVTVSGNSSVDGGGLAILNGAANVTLVDSTISSNTAARRGGGMLADASTTTFNRVTVDGNSCTASAERGGGIHFRGGGTATLTNVTVSGNACDEGGGISVEGGHTVNLTNVTLSANGAPSGGGGLWHGGGTLTILNTIIANSTSGGDCNGTIVDGGNNLDTDGTCLVTLTAAPLLGALQFNGGPTRTHALLTGSPALDAGTNIGCPATDQRGVGRPINGTCDIGAYEGITVSTVISGAVLEDVNGDSGLGDAVGVGNVRVRLYEDVNDNGLVDAGDLFSAETLTAAVTGAYSFSVSTGTNFLVAVDSKTVAPSAGFNGGSGQSEIWSEQTYGDNSATPALDLGPRVGGRSATTPDDVDPILTLPADNEYQHLARVDVSGGNVTGVDFAFSFNVISNTLDGADADLVNPRTRQGTLRQLVQNANAILNTTTTNIPSGTYNLSIAGTAEDAAVTGDLDITDGLTLNGAGAGSTIIDGNGIDRVFHVLVGPTVIISNVTIRDGDAAGDDGGGIWNESNLTLNNATMSNNAARDGGAVFSEQNPNSLTLTNVNLNNNSATRNGGAIGMIDDNASLTFTDVTMTGNTAAAIGGAFYGERASGTMTRVTVSGNSSEDGGGLAMLNSAANVTLVDSTISGNTATRRGGGILVDAATTNFNRVTLNANSCTAEDGGGVHVRGGGTASLLNVTLSGNTCDSGGGLHVEGGGDAILTHVTVTGNGAPGGGGGLSRSGGTLTIQNTIVADSISGGNCTGTIISAGNNLDSANTCLLTGPGDLIDSTPILGSLQNNGGLTQTHALGIGSAAIDTGTNTACTPTDQRGFIRPVDGDGDAIAVCDIGSYEAGTLNAANLALTKTDSADPVSVANTFTYTLTVTNNGPTDATNVTLVDTLPADVDWQAATPSQGSCVHSGEPLGGTVTCTLGTLANGASATVDIEVDAPLTPGVIDNSATVSADEPDPDSNDNTAAEDTTIIDPSANLRVTQVEDFDPAGVNLPFVYTVTVTNAGPANATLVTLVDTLDSAVTYQTAVPSQGSCSETGGVVTCDLGALANGSIATIDITVIAPATPQIVTSTAVVSAAEPDLDLNDNTWAEDTDVINPPPADLSLTKIDTPDPVVSGTPLTYTLTIDNLGPGPATQVLLTDTLPAGVTFISATPSEGSCSEAGGIVSCPFPGAITNGASENVVIVVTAPATPGVITNNAAVSTVRPDPDSSNDSASADTTVTVIGAADLALSKSDSPDPVNVVQQLSYSLLVDNLGPDDATDVVLVDTLPPTVTFQSVITSQGSCSEAGGTVTCNLGIIANAANAMVDIIVTAPFSTGTITNNASVSASSIDSNAANDTASEDTFVQNLNVNQVCYLVADAGGGGGGNDLLTRIDTADFDPLTNETNIGIGTGTNQIEAIAWNSAAMVLYAANANRLGTLSTTTGVFTALPQAFGTGSGILGNINFTDIDGLAYDATSGILYGSERQSGADVLIQINMATGAHVPNAFGANLDYVPIVPIAGNNLTDDIAVDPTTGVMYASTNSGGSTDRLIIIDKFLGTTTSVGVITVPDIEGLGTDPTGQLWGTSGTQGILYEINKATGEGTNPRPIDNGSDYEAVDCYAFSPSVIADLAAAKNVDNATPVEGTTVTYSVDVTNNGPATATVAQLADLLPAGVTFVSAAPTQGTYDSFSGSWFIGSIGSGATATLTIQASVDVGTAGSTITNLASIVFLSQFDPDSSNDTASVDIIPVALADIEITKTVVTLEDPLNLLVDPKAIPGATVLYTVTLTNVGGVAANVDTVVITEPVPPNTALRVIDFDGSNPGPVAFVDVAPLSGLTYTFVSLGDPGDDIEFSDDDGSTYVYVPVADGNGVDTAVTHMRINMKGAFLSGSPDDPNFEILFKNIVQ